MDYKHGLELLKEIAKSAGWEQEVLPYEARLLSNLQEEALYGPAPQTQQERWRVIDQLNQLCIRHLSVNFNDLCRDIRPSPSSVPTQLEEAFGATLCLYADSDALFYQKLKTALSQWQQQGKIKWLEISAGDPIAPLQQRHIRQANLILLLCSADFFATPTCYTAMLAALRERAQRQLAVVPILVRACAWDESPCGNLNILPENELPLSEWTHPDQAYESIRRSLIQISRHAD